MSRGHLESSKCRLPIHSYCGTFFRDHGGDFCEPSKFVLVVSRDSCRPPRQHVALEHQNRVGRPEIFEGCDPCSGIPPVLPCIGSTSLLDMFSCTLDVLRIATMRLAMSSTGHQSLLTRLIYCRISLINLCFALLSLAYSSVPYSLPPIPFARTHYMSGSG